MLLLCTSIHLSSFSLCTRYLRKYLKKGFDIRMRLPELLLKKINESFFFESYAPFQAGIL